VERRGLSSCFRGSIVSADRFHHREHIHVAWLYLKSNDASRAAERMSEGIRRVRESPWRDAEYHHTLTLALMRWLPAPWWKHRRDTRLSSSSTAHPQLKDTNLLAKYYSKELLQTAAAAKPGSNPTSSRSRT